MDTDIVTSNHKVGKSIKRQAILPKRKEGMQKPCKYDVFMTLSGHTSARRFCKSYRSLGHAKRFCDQWAGYGRTIRIVDSEGNEVYTVHVVPC